MSSDRFTGCVKWFDSRKGYGFVTCMDRDTEYSDKDIFIHYSSISVDGHYKKVFPGEYVSFNVDTNEDKQNVTKNVRGVMDGPLLVENESYNYRVIRKDRDRYQTMDQGENDQVNDETVNEEEKEEASEEQ